VQDPYKNDLLRWIVGADPRAPMRADPTSKHHKFVVVKSSEFPDHFRGYRMACNMGKLKGKVRVRRGPLEPSPPLESGEGAPAPRGTHNPPWHRRALPQRARVQGGMCISKDRAQMTCRTNPAAVPGRTGR
jgi:hypothetical protein